MISNFVNPDTLMRMVLKERERLTFIFYLFGSHIPLCLRVTSSSALRNYSWKCSRRSYGKCLYSRQPAWFTFRPANLKEKSGSPSQIIITQ